VSNRRSWTTLRSPQNGALPAQLLDFSNGVSGVDERVVRNLFFSAGLQLSVLRSKVPIWGRLYYDLHQPSFARRRSRIAEVLHDEFDITGRVEFRSHPFRQCRRRVLCRRFRGGVDGNPGRRWGRPLFACL